MNGGSGLHCVEDYLSPITRLIKFRPSWNYLSIITNKPCLLILSYLKSLARFKNWAITQSWNGNYAKRTNGSPDIVYHPEEGVNDGIWPWRCRYDTFLWVGEEVVVSMLEMAYKEEDDPFMACLFSTNSFAQPFRLLCYRQKKG